jgi:hypothetical protein
LLCWAGKKLALLHLHPLTILLLVAALVVEQEAVILGAAAAVERVVLEAGHRFRLQQRHHIQLLWVAVALELQAPVLATVPTEIPEPNQFFLQLLPLVAAAAAEQVQQALKMGWTADLVVAVVQTQGH